MPSPIAHLGAGYVLFAFFRRHLSPAVIETTGRGLILLAICFFFSMLPDIDAVPGFLSGDMGRYHNQWTHSLLWALGLSALLAAIVYAVKRKAFLAWFTLLFSCYSIHIVMDYFTYGRGVRLLWPVAADRFKSDPSFFGGLHWSEGLFSSNHIWTAIEEISFGAILIAAYHIFEFICRRLSEARRNSRE